MPHEWDIINISKEQKELATGSLATEAGRSLPIVAGYWCSGAWIAPELRTSLYSLASTTCTTPS